MRLRPHNVALIAALAALLATTGAAQQFVRAWNRVAPEDEEFAVLMPEPNFRIRREIPFNGGIVLRPASFEITYRGALFSVLSFSKSEAATPKTLDEFVKGFSKGLQNNSTKTTAKLQFERNLTLDGRAGKQFKLAVGDALGTARIFETEKHFYVVLTLGADETESTADRFQSSFTFDRAGESKVSDKETTTVPPEPRQPPAPLWPVAGSPNVLATANTSPKAQSQSTPDAPTSADRKIITGGVLTGKTLVKPPPVYPPIAKAARAQGTVTVQILIDEEGYVIAANAVSGHPLLQQAAVFAARQARFTPTLLEGKPVKVSGVIDYNFTLVGGNSPSHN
jgi:TonB family protein